VTVGTGTDDIQAVDTTKPADEQLKQKVLVQITQNQFALRLEFFKRLSVAPLLPDRLRVYTLNYPDGITHTKLILVDDEALSIGSANANPRGFVFDTELNVVLDHAEPAKTFRQALWAHNLGIDPAKVATWRVSQFFDNWDRVANGNLRVQTTPEKMVGEGVIPFKPTDSSDPRFRQGKRAPIVLPKGLLVGPIRLPFDRSVEAPDSLF
jgi:phosphatidylserine/phosphatidylglycerophosphate/cardiolipin synthase-like enzyme